MTISTSRSVLALSTLALALVAGCADGADGLQGCRSSSDCATGLRCAVGRCVAPAVDAGPHGDARPPSIQVDSGVTLLDPGGCSPPSDGSCGACDVCGDGLDNDCDGQVDDGCPCTIGDTAPCYPGPTQPALACALGTMSCGGAEFGAWGACENADTPHGDEICDNGLDDDCDGAIDDGCCSDVTASMGLDPGTPLSAPQRFVVFAPEDLFPGQDLHVQLVGGHWDDCGTVGNWSSSCTYGVTASYGGGPVEVVDRLTRSVGVSVTNLISGGCSWEVTLRWCSPAT